MTPLRRWLLAILILITLALIGINLTQNDQSATTTVDPNVPNYSSKQTTTIAYTPTGLLYYKLMTKQTEYFTQDKSSQFTQPILIMFDNTHQPTWHISSDKAKLTDNKTLYLYGNVKVDSLTAKSELQHITTNSAQINLNTQDVMSDDQVTLYGINFISQGMKMRGNLRDKNAQLIEQVKTSYEIQPKTTNS